MSRLKKIVAAVAALAALALGGAAIAGATGGGDGSERGDGDGELSAAVEKQAGDAALKATGGGTLGQMERDGEKGATYEVEVKKRRTGRRWTCASTTASAWWPSTGTTRTAASRRATERSIPGRDPAFGPGRAPT